MNENFVGALPDISTLKLSAGDRALARLTKIRLDEAPEGSSQRDLAGDIFQEYFQSRPEARDDVPQERATNRALLDWMKDSHGWEKSRANTRANMAASMISTSLMWNHLQNEDTLKEALDRQEEASEAAQEAKAAERMANALAGSGDADLAAQAEALLEKAAEAGKRAEAAAAAAAEMLEEAQESPLQRAKMKAAAKAASDEAEKVAASAAGWGMGPGSPVYNDPKAAQAFLEKNQGDIARIAQLAGRFRGFALQARKERAPQGIIPAGAGMTRDLMQAFPTELALLRPDAPPILRADKMAQYAEFGVIGYRPAGDKDKAGAFVAATDVSPSMHGPRDIVGKAVSLGVSQVARQESRPYTLFGFASDRALAEETIVNDTEGWDKHLAWAGTVHRGGTDFNMALELSMEHLNDMGRRGKGADLLFISDGEAGIKDEMAARWAAFKEETGARLFYVPVAGVYTPPSGWQAIEDVADKTVPVRELDEKTGAGLAAELGEWLR